MESEGAEGWEREDEIRAKPLMLVLALGMLVRLRGKLLPRSINNE